MKLFIDSANPEEIKKVADLGILGGVTTNPTLIAKQLSAGGPTGKISDQKKILSEICRIAPVDILAEPISTDYKNILQESMELSKISHQIVAKIPITPDGLRAIKSLRERNIKTALTLIFSTAQALIAAVAGVDYICPFVGRLDAIKQHGLDLIRDIVATYRHYHFKTKIVVASVRNINHVTTSAQYGADAVTVPSKIIDEMLKHDLTTKGIQKFLEDWTKVSGGPK